MLHEVENDTRDILQVEINTIGMYVCMYVCMYACMKLSIILTSRVYELKSLLALSDEYYM